jgi:hypothetical protein
VTEIRSYRRVFDLERRIYSVERLRLNPSGVPVRGVVYLLGAIAAMLVFARLPLVSAPLGVLPWFVRDLGAPAALAAALTVIRIDGRTFHQAARAAVSFWTTPRSTIALGEPSRIGTRWRPEELLFLPDGSEAAPRRLRYRGPGSIVVLVAHHTEPFGGERRARRRGTTRLVLSEPVRGLTRCRVIELERGASAWVVGERTAERR